MRWTRALVTGASSGIGREMCRQLAAEGTDLVVVARDGERLQALAEELDVHVEVLCADLSDPEAVASVAARIEQTNSPVDLVVNNAGFSPFGAVVDLSVEALQSVVAVNVSALLHLSQVAAVTFTGRGEGTILNVSSVASFTPAVNSATYNATKAFVTSLTQSMHEELRGTEVKISAICPGLTRTEFQERANFDTTGLHDILWQTPEAVATAGLDGAYKNRAVVVSGAKNKVAAVGLKLMPSVLKRRLAGAVTK